MQSLDWYLHRLRGMSAGEIAWRTRATCWEALDRCRVGIGWRPKLDAAWLAAAADSPRSLRLTGVQPGDWKDSLAGSPEAVWRDRLLARAERIAAHRLSFFDIHDRHLGDPIDWNRDHASGQASPMGFAPAIDYRDYRVTGDAKLVWEPNRHHHLVVLGRAYRASGEKRYAAAAVEQLQSWLEQCPYGRGMNWRSPLELAIRLINWVWTIDLIRDSGLYSGEFRTRLLDAVWAHLHEVARKYSQGSSANNHRIGEAAGVFVGASYFGDLPDSNRLREEAREILTGEILAQTYADGCNRELALGYHLFVLQFFLVAGALARRSARNMPSGYWTMLERKLAFLSALTEGGDALPMFGDSDDGYVLDLGALPGPDPTGLLGVGAVLVGGASEPVEAARWLFDGAAGPAPDAVTDPASSVRLGSRAFPESGHYLLQSGRPGMPQRISVLFDCGELGFGSIAAHGHADALSFCLRAFGRDVLVDPGTYDYFTYPAWRDYFRSTRAHNTLVVDDQDQSVMLGPFLWGERARARCLSWRVLEDGAQITAEHDGYSRLADPVVHRRHLTLEGAARSLTIHDEVLARGAHTASAFFHLAEDCVVRDIDSNRVRVALGAAQITLVLDPAFAVQIVCGSEDPIGGWVSRGYHRKTRASTVIGRASTKGNTSFQCRIELGEAG